jgi:hypothetical protein
MLPAFRASSRFFFKSPGRRCLSSIPLRVVSEATVKQVATWPLVLASARRALASAASPSSAVFPVLLGHGTDPDTTFGAKAGMLGGSASGSDGVTPAVGLKVGCTSVAYQNCSPKSPCRPPDPQITCPPIYSQRIGRGIERRVWRRTGRQLCFSMTKRASRMHSSMPTTSTVSSCQNQPKKQGQLVASLLQPPRFPRPPFATKL